MNDLEKLKLKRDALLLRINGIGIKIEVQRNKSPHSINSDETFISLNAELTKAKDELKEVEADIQEIESKEKEEIKISVAKTQSNVEEMGKTTLHLTWVLAVSTGIAALYYLFELLKEVFHITFR